MGESFVILGVQIKLEPLYLGASNTLTIVENILEMRKLWSPKVKRIKNSKKNKPPNNTKANY
jgi:hypothetical protein